MQYFRNFAPAHFPSWTLGLVSGFRLFNDISNECIYIFGRNESWAVMSSITNSDCAFEFYHGNAQALQIWPFEWAKGYWASATPLANATAKVLAADTLTVRPGCFGDTSWDFILSWC